MNESAAWKLKGHRLTLNQACKEFDVRAEIIWSGINSGQLEFLQGMTKGVQWTKIIKEQLEAYIKQDPAGARHLRRMRAKEELLKVNRSITCLKRVLEELEERRIEVEKWLAHNSAPQ